MAGALIFVLHARPESRPGIPSHEWRLSQAAKEDAVLLSHALPPELAPVAWSSAEPRARETAAVIALRKCLRVEPEPRFAEVDRAAGGWLDDYDAAAEVYLRTGAHAGWEPRRSVAARFEAAVAALPPDSRDTVIVTHGLALTCWLASRIPLAAPAWWRALTLPDAWRFEPHTGSLERLFAMTPRGASARA